jgi:hypothetical protein
MPRVPPLGLAPIIFGRAIGRFDVIGAELPIASFKALIIASFCAIKAS